jgi:hypothetical protein
MYELPRVKREITASVEHEIRSCEDAKYVKDKIKDLKKKNPVIADFIAKFSRTSEDPISTAFCGLIVYRLLESQAECTQLEMELMV